MLMEEAEEKHIFSQLDKEFILKTFQYRKKMDINLNVGFTENIIWKT